MGKLITALELSDHLGVDKDCTAQVQQHLDMALVYLCAATGIDWSQQPDPSLANEAIMTRVWLTFYGTRGAQGTSHLGQHLTALVKQLQYAGRCPDVS